MICIYPHPLSQGTETSMNIIVTILALLLVALVVTPFIKLLIFIAGGQFAWGATFVAIFGALWLLRLVRGFIRYNAFLMKKPIH